MKKIFNKNLLFKIFAFLNRFAHWCDFVIFYFLTDWVYNTQFKENSLGWLCYIPLIFQLYLCIKYEWLVFKSRGICENILYNGRVMGFSGKQGCGKSSFACYLASFRRFSKVYSNIPLQIKNKFTRVLESDILLLNSKIEDNSLLFIDEATLFYHNLKTQNNNNLSDSLYSQEILTQLIRHFFDGNLFYISTDINRLPQVLKENIGLTNFMLRQDNKIVSYLTGNIVVLVGKLLGFNFKNGIRHWQFQQFEKIPDKNYTFDLANQESDTNLKNYANLIDVYAFNNPNLFNYDDRFMKGVYAELPKHIDNYWESLEFNGELLSQIGYGEIVNYFRKKKK